MCRTLCPGGSTRLTRQRPRPYDRAYVNDPSTGTPLFTRRVFNPIEGPPSAGGVYVGVVGVMVPVGSQYRFVASQGQTRDWEPFPGVDSGVLKVSSPNFDQVQRVEWPANVVTDVTIYWFANGTTPPPGMSLTPHLVVENA